MDAIDRAIAAKWHIMDNSILNGQTWEEFEDAIKGKKVVLFGIGNGAEYYFYKYKENAIVDQIIDNDKTIQGYDAGEIIGEMYYFHNELKIADISALEQYDVNAVVVLIASLRHYAEIAKQLDEKGFHKYFAILPMEANQRKRDGIGEQEDREAYYLRESLKHKIDNKKVVFYTMGNYSGHGKYIVQQILKVRNDLDIVWVVNHLSVKVPDGIRLIYSRNKRKYIEEMETAGFWIYDNTVPSYIIKRQGQKYIQIKHWSSITLKTFGLDYSSFRKESSKIASYKYDGGMMDYIITGSKFDEESCRRAFGFSGEVYEAGSPRTDVLFQSIDFIKKIHDYYHIDQEKHTLLYAPTFRLSKGTQQKFQTTQIDLHFEMTRKALEGRFGGEWLILLRLHPNVALESSKIERPEYVIDVSAYSDSQELVAASDVVITDYSSIMFEPAFIKKPVFLFAADKKDYINSERELLIDYDSLPFSVAESNEELVENIRNFNQEDYEVQVEKFLSQYGIHEDGHASERAANFILQLIDG